MRFPWASLPVLCGSSSLFYYVQVFFWAIHFINLKTFLSDFKSSTIFFQFLLLADVTVVRHFFACVDLSTLVVALFYSKCVSLHSGVHYGASLSVPFLALFPHALRVLDRAWNSSFANFSVSSIESRAEGFGIHCDSIWVNWGIVAFKTYRESFQACVI